MEDDASVTTVPQRAPEMFSAGMVASRGFLPEAWEEELDAERSNPGALFHSFLEDVRYGCRLVQRNSLLSLVVVLTLTVGIGINASVFTVVNGMMLRPHVSGNPETFLRIVPESRLTSVPRQLSYHEYLALRDHNRSLRQLAAFSYFPAMIGDDDPGGNPGIAVSCNFFLVEGLARPLLGRLLDASDCEAPGQAPAAVINERTWRTRFAADPNVAGRSVRLNNRPVTIVGVVPDLTTGWFTPPSIWIPYTSQPYMDSTRNGFTDENLLWLSLCGRLAHGFSRSQARAEFEILERQEDRQHTGRSTAVVTTDGSWLEQFELNASGRDLMLLAFFLGSFALVLLIACANVATLLLSRAASRRKEIAVRLSLGAPRIRLVRMLITESLILASIAGAASVYIVRHIPHPLFRYLAPRSPEFPMNPDWLIFTYLAAVVLLCGIFSGLAPAIESVNVDLASSIKGQAGSPAGNRIRGWLVSAQVAMSMVLLVGAGLFGKAEDRTLHADSGYLPQKVVVAPVRFPESTTVEAARVRLDVITQRVRALPGVHSVAFSDGLPMIDCATVGNTAAGAFRRRAASGCLHRVTRLLRYAGTYDRARARISGGRPRCHRGFPKPGTRVLAARRSAREIRGPERNHGNRGRRSQRRRGQPLRRLRESPGLSRAPCASQSQCDGGMRFDGDPRAGANAVRAAFREYDAGMFVTTRVLQNWIDQITEVLWNIVSLILLLGVVATVLATTGIYWSGIVRGQPAHTRNGYPAGVRRPAIAYRPRDLPVGRPSGAARLVPRSLALLVAVARNIASWHERNSAAAR